MTSPSFTRAQKAALLNMYRGWLICVLDGLFTLVEEPDYHVKTSMSVYLALKGAGFLEPQYGFSLAGCYILNAAGRAYCEKDSWIQNGTKVLMRNGEICMEDQIDPQPHQVRSTGRCPRCGSSLLWFLTGCRACGHQPIPSPPPDPRDTRIAELEAQLQRAEAALKPFADYPADKPIQFGFASAYDAAADYFKNEEMKTRHEEGAK